MPEGVDESSVAGVDGASVVVDRCSVGVEACLVVMVVVAVVVMMLVMMLPSSIPFQCPAQ